MAKRWAGTSAHRDRPSRTQPPTPLLDTWQRSGLPARDFGALANISRHTLYSWNARFEAQSPAGLMDKPRGQPRRELLSYGP